jgi:hypothetical protein
MTIIISELDVEVEDTKAPPADDSPPTPQEPPVQAAVILELVRQQNERMLRVSAY